MNKRLSKLIITAAQASAHTPLEPSLLATRKVKNPLPVPTICPDPTCASPVALMHHTAIYNGHAHGDWPWVYACTKCDNHVGLHAYTAIPLGSLANAKLRKARREAKTAFNLLWQYGAMTRSQAYLWLASELGITNYEECHIGWFDIAQCMKALEVCEAKTKKAAK